MCLMTKLERLADRLNASLRLSSGFRPILQRARNVKRQSWA